MKLRAFCALALAIILLLSAVAIVGAQYEPDAACASGETFPKIDSAEGRLQLKLPQGCGIINKSATP